jgi:hypothetical protein
LRNESGKNPPLYEREGNSPGDISDISETVHQIDSANNKWTTVKPKCRKKVSPVKIAELNNASYIAAVNQYDHLLNVQDTQEDNVQPVTQGQCEPLKAPPVKIAEVNNVSHLATAKQNEHLRNLQDIQEENVHPVTQGQWEISYGDRLQDEREDDTTAGTHGQDNIPEIPDGGNLKHTHRQQDEKTQQTGKNVEKSKENGQRYHIPTILNGKIEEKNTGRTCKEEIYKNRENKTIKLKQHKVI